MEKRRVLSYIVLGGQGRYLEDVTGKTPIKSTGHALHNLERFLQRLDELDLPVTKSAAEYVQLHKLLDEWKEEDENATVGADKAAELAREMEKVRVALFAESRQKLAFIVTPKRIDSEKLLDDPGSLMAPGVYDSLDELVRFDLSEAAKCIAFERPTAGAFHLMRATEGSLREMYRALVKRGRVDPLLWYSMVEHLRGRSKPPPRPLLDQLDGIRHNFRNPTQHPDAVYDIHEVQDLWALAVDAITRMRRLLES